MHLNLLLLPFFFILMVGDVIGRIKHNQKMVAFCQPGTTIVVALIAAYSFLLKGHQTPYVIAVVIALIVSAVADALLVDRDDPKGFIKGMALFFVAITIYGVIWTVLSGIHTNDYMITFTMIVFYLFLLFIFYKGQYTDERRPSKVEFIGIVVYLFAFCMVISRAVATSYGDYFSLTQRVLFTSGIILFFMGDCQLGIYHFINLKFPMKQAPPFYFIGQLLIGLSCTYF